MWIGGEWHAEHPLSVRLVGCVTCHTEGNEGNRFELVEGVARLDLDQWLRGEQTTGLQGAVEGGRFVVPFGAFSGQSHPAAYRTVSRPLIYNMGQMVARDNIGPAVLPMPYSDEGVLLDLSVPLVGEITATAKGYLVNGLQGGFSGVDFFQSRDYADNNSEPTAGARVTVGNALLRLGGSVMGGQFSDDTFADPLNYTVAGADVMLRYRDRARFQAEYAVRNSERFVFAPGGSNLLLNHEYWRLPRQLDDVNVFGVRWVGAF